MFSKEQKKFKKRKDRQKIAKSKILKRREIALEESRKEKALLKEKYKIKQLDEVSPVQIAQAFNRKDLIIYTNPAEFKDYLFAQDFNNSALLLMSSGNYGGLNFDEVKDLMH